MIEKIYEKLDVLGLLTILISLLALLTHNYFRGLTFLWIVVGALFIKRDGYKKIELEIPLLIYIGTLFISLLMPLDFKHSYKEIYRQLYGFIAPFMIGQFIIDKEKKRRYIDYLMKGITTYFFIKTVLMVFKYMPSQFRERYVALPINPVEFSYIAGVVAIYSWVVFLRENDRYKKILNSIFVGMILYVILQTKTRGAWLGLLASLSIVYIFKNEKFIKNTAKTITVFLGLSGVVYIFRKNIYVLKYYNRLLSIMNTKNDYSNTSRLIAWKIGWDRFKEKPLTGWGYKVKNPYPTGPGGANQVLDHPHNEYIAFLVGGGVIGLLGYLYLMISIFIKAIKNRNNAYWLVMLGLVSFTLVYGVVEALFQVSNSLFLFLIMIGVVVQKDLEVRETKK